MGGGGRPAAGFTLLHLMAAVAVSAYALGASLPVELRRATVERGVAETEAGMRALASAARERHDASGAWPPDLASALVQADAVLSERHALGGAYAWIVRATGSSNTKLADQHTVTPWRSRHPALLDGWLSIGACGLAPEAQNALAARLGGSAWLDPPASPGGVGCVRWELPPFGRESAHVDTGGGPLYAGIGIAPGTAGYAAPPPWTGDLVVQERNPPDFDVRAALRRNGDVEANDVTVGGATVGLGVDVAGGDADFHNAYPGGMTPGVRVIAETVYTPDLFY